MIHVPEQFRHAHPFEYPENNKIIFEDWFQRNWTENDKRERTYLPITWTSYYCANKYGQNRKSMHDLQAFIDRLDRSKKYYTIVQYDNGILTNIRGLDIKIYAMSGPRIDYPLPLLCQPHPYHFNEKRNIFANFVGGATHPIRKELFRWFRNKSGFVFSFKKIACRDFCQTLARSVFTLCPRGYGQTSFRIAEALQYGSIPVYVSDQHILPHGRPFDYGVLVSPKDFRRIEHDLRQMSNSKIFELRERGESAYKELFTYEGSKKLILENLQVG